MKVLNLQCGGHHAFEGWFASEDDFQDQLARRLIECPLCADASIRKMPSAPRLNLGASTASRAVPNAAKAAGGHPSPDGSAGVGVGNPVAAASAPPTSLTPAAQAAFLKAVRQLVARTEDVGERFADEARRMHYGESEARDIRGQASLRETVDLLEEGIAVMPLPMLPALKETLQ